ncbi:MAG: Eco57I restriction-modification methylase domain-containing protein [Bacteroidales bacterium]
MLLDYIINQTEIFLNSKTKSERKLIGQFFTSKETAIYMSSLFDVPDKTSLEILDPGSGSGILSAALVEYLYNNYPNKEVKLTCYENNPDILPVLQGNLEYLHSNMNMKFEYTIITDNYISSQKAEFNHELIRELNPHKYDLVIGNPPYLKVSKDAVEAKSMPEVCHGAPNLYFLFAAMSLFNLKDEGEMVYIIPRSWTSGAYFTRFREYLLKKGQIMNIHLFVSRDKVFEKEEVLQETIIIRIKKTKKVNPEITITTSNSNQDFHSVSHFRVKREVVISGKSKFIFLVTNEQEVQILEKIEKFSYTLPDLNIKMKTGLTVDFRCQELLCDEPEGDTIPLFYSQHIQNGSVVFPIGKDKEYIKTSQKGLIQKNENYLFVKRFTSKEESRRLQCGIYLSEKYPDYDYISTQNKINFIGQMKGDTLSADFIYGLYVLFNSTIYDKYYRILNGSTQVNSTEVNTLPVPDAHTIEVLGKQLKDSADLSTSNCDLILDTIL